MRHPLRASAAPLLACALSLAACERSAPASAAGAALLVTWPAATVPQTVAAGWTPLRLRLADSVGHNAVALRVPAGMTPQAFVAALDTAVATPPGGVALGGPESPTQAGETSEAIVRLDTGTVVVACLLRDAGGHRHAARGEWRAIEVRAAGGASAAAAPASAIEVRATDFAFATAATWPAGAQRVRVRNVGAGDHLLLLARMHDGLGLREWMDARDVSTVADPAVGIARLSAGQEAYLPVTLRDGTYVLFCLVRDPKTRKLHADLGMVRTVQVGGAAGAS